MRGGGGRGARGGRAPRRRGGAARRRGAGRAAGGKHMSATRCLLGLLAALGAALLPEGLDPAPLLRGAQARHPGDCWLNLTLGNALSPPRLGEAVGYHRAALAARPPAP